MAQKPAGAAARALLLALLAALGARADDEREPLSAPWRALAPGVDVASAADLGGDPSWAARVVVVDPGKARFAVRFDSSRPTLEAWRERYPEALAISVGSFFSTDRGQIRPTCDLISEGRFVKGAGCHREDVLYFGAHPRARPAPPPPAASAAVPLVAREASGRDAKGRADHARERRRKHHAAPLPAPAPPALPAPRLLTAAEFHADEWTEAMKSFPALVHAGYPACVGAGYCAEVSRSAALAWLRDGRVLLFASQWPAVRKDVARFLADTLGAEEAVNLDGGPEATLALRGEAPEDAVSTARVGLPFVLLVLPPETAPEP